MSCKARRYSDQMLCECGLAWDVNDPEPPKCKTKEYYSQRRARVILNEIKEMLKCTS